MTCHSVVLTDLVRLVAAFLVVDPLVELLFDAVVRVEVFFFAAEARVVVFFALLDDVVVLALRVVPPLVLPSLVASTAFFVLLVERRELASVDPVVACPACASTAAAFLRVVRRVVVPFC